jgi:alpha-D-ribose 1-methylphosphonate 5-triphosphate synthase subunit PhnH
MTRAAPGAALGGLGIACLVPGFGDPIHGAQATFRAVLDTMSHPGRLKALPATLAAPPPEPLGPAAAALALTLCDIDTPIYLDEALAPAAPYLAFHCGAPMARSPAGSRFAFFARAAELPCLGDFELGSDDYPDRSTTLIVAVAGLAGDGGVVLRGPGIRGEARLRVAGLPARFWTERAALEAQFPRGLDCVLASGARIVALPRSTRVTFEGGG